MKKITDLNIKKKCVDQVLTAFGNLHFVSLALRDAIEKESTVLFAKGGTDIVLQGDFCNDFYFVCEGLLLSDSGINKKRIITWFSKTGDSATSISGLYGRVPSQERIFSHGNSTLLSLNASVIQNFYKEFPEMNIIMRKIFEYYFQEAQIRSIVIRMGTSRDKYNYFRKMYVEYFDVVPMDAIASYLGVKLSTLKLIIREDRQCKIKDKNTKRQYQKLLYYMETEKVYLQSYLTLKILAEDLEVTPHQLSNMSRPE